MVYTNIANVPEREEKGEISHRSHLIPPYSSTKFFLSSPGETWAPSGSPKRVRISGELRVPLTQLTFTISDVLPSREVSGGRISTPTQGGRLSTPERLRRHLGDTTLSVSLIASSVSVIPPGCCFV